MGKSRLMAAGVGVVVCLWAVNQAHPGDSTTTVNNLRVAAGDAAQGVEGFVQDAAVGAGPMFQGITGAVQQSGVGNMLGGQPTATTQPGAVPPAQQPSADGR